MHLTRCNIYEEVEVWCGEHVAGLTQSQHTTENFDAATCKECLKAAAVYGEQASLRLNQDSDHASPNSA